MDLLRVYCLTETGNFLIYHVDKSVIKSEVSEILNLNWLYPNKSPFLEIDKRDISMN